MSSFTHYFLKKLHTWHFYTNAHTKHLPQKHTTVYFKTPDNLSMAKFFR